LPLAGEQARAQLKVIEGDARRDHPHSGRAALRTNWWLGDWWAFGAARYGERRALVDGENWDGPSFKTCAIAGSVARVFETSRRREVLSFKHHAEVAALPAAVLRCNQFSAPSSPMRVQARSLISAVHTSSSRSSPCSPLTPPRRRPHHRRGA